MRRWDCGDPHAPGLAEGDCVDVHSRVLIIDDSVVCIGSSNLCNRSMALDTHPARVREEVFLYRMALRSYA